MVPVLLFIKSDLTSVDAKMNIRGKGKIFQQTLQGWRWITPSDAVIV
jgi:hypothetical protein